jgi:UPF0755 protein
MVKKILLLVIVGLAIGGIVLRNYLYGDATAFDKDSYTLYIKTNSTYSTVYSTLLQDEVLSHPSFFNWLAKKINYPNNVKAGKYIIKKNSSAISLLRMLKGGRQEAVNFTITKFRLPENLAAAIGRKFECDSVNVMRFLTHTDSLKKYGLDTNTVMTAILPNTYSFYWNTSPSKIFGRLFEEYKNFWNITRINQAKERGLTPTTAYILASIIEEETNALEEKDTIASVYLNRMAKNIKLGADPTVKFALRNFALKRIYSHHLEVFSPFNTYKVQGLPPGPICTPSTATINAVLQSPHTNYFFFVASSSFNGRHCFANNYADHMKLAKAYHKALDQRMEEKKEALENDLNK